MNSLSSESEIEIVVNDLAMDVAAGTTIESLLKLLGIRSPAVAVELNLEIQPRDVFERRSLQAGDQVEIVTLVGGG